MFFVYAVLGWCAEVAFAAVNSGRFVNRGFLNGPWCPIYGFGVVIVVLVLTPVEENTAMLFAGAVVLTSALEWITGCVLEKAFHARWWDYSGLPFNIGGYVCLKFSLMWGLACVLVMRVLHPTVMFLIARARYGARRAHCGFGLRHGGRPHGDAAGHKEDAVQAAPAHQADGGPARAV